LTPVPRSKIKMDKNMYLIVIDEPVLGYIPVYIRKDEQEAIDYCKQQNSVLDEERAKGYDIPRSFKYTQIVGEWKQP